MIKITTAYGGTSNKHLSTVDEKLQKVANLALVYANLLGRDISIVEGYRSSDRQADLFAKGATKVLKGKHNYNPSRALDFIPYHIKFKGLVGSSSQIDKIAKSSRTTLEKAERKLHIEYSIIASCFFLASQELGIPIRWGGDWNMDNDLFDNNFDDMGHIELL